MLRGFLCALDTSRHTGENRLTIAASEASVTIDVLEARDFFEAGMLREQDCVLYRGGVPRGGKRSAAAPAMNTDSCTGTAVA